MAWMTPNIPMPEAMAGSRSTATRVTFGAISLGNSSHFPPMPYSGCWAERATAKGWDALGLFGCGLHRPLVHRGAAGLLWAIAGGRLVELHRDWAVVELPENGSRRIFDRLPARAPAWKKARASSPS